MLFAPRMDLLSTNEEGIVSLFGYFTIHLLGLSTGIMISPPSPSYFHRQRLETTKAQSWRNSNAGLMTQSGMSPQHKDVKTVTELAGYVILWWTFLGLNSFFPSIAGVLCRLVCFAICPLSLGSLTFWIGQLASHSMGVGVLHFLHAHILVVGSFLLSITPPKPIYYSPTSKLKVTRGRWKFPVETQTLLVLLQVTNQNGLLVFLLMSKLMILR